MSGIELALSIAPLIIAGAESSRNLWITSKTVIQQDVKRDKHMDFLRGLLYEMRMLQMILRTLVSELPTLSQGKKMALVEHDTECWKNKEVTLALKERLREAEDAFRETLDTLLKALDGLLRHRSSETENIYTSQPSSVFSKLEELKSNLQSESSRAERFKARFKFATSEKNRLYAMHRIVQCNEKLQKLLDQASKIPIEPKQSSHRTGPPLDQCRKLVNALHKTMSSHWRCGCEPPHEAKLCLLRCFSTPETDSTITSLDMLISAPPDDGRDRKVWQESHVRIVAEQKPDEQSPTVRFEVNGEIVHSESTSNPQRTEVVSLCTLVKEQGLSSISLGIDFEAGTLWRSRPRRKSLVVTEPDEIVLLGDLLEMNAWEMTLKKKRILAVIVAHAVLNFCEGPWLDKHWDKQNISFFRDASLGNGLDLARPYLSTTFQRGPSTDTNAFDFQSLHQSPPILALGVLLLELELCNTIESHWLPGDLVDGKPNPNTNLTTAQRLLEERVENLYENYRSAIEACLKCDFMTDEDYLSLESNVFRRRIYERIVAPLEDELEHCSGLTPDKLLGLETNWLQPTQVSG